MIEYDKWYIFNNNSYKEDFIAEVKKNELLWTDTLNELKAQLLIGKANCIKLRNKVAYNYRTVYRPEYMQDVEVYVPDKYQKEYNNKYNDKKLMMKEAWKLYDNTVYGSPVYEKAEEPYSVTKGDNMVNTTTIEEAINDVIKQYYDKNMKNINNDAEEAKDLIYKSADIAETAKPYYDAICAYYKDRKISNCIDFRGFVIPYLTIDELKALDEIDDTKRKYIDELNEHCKMVKALALQADTFEQRMAIYMNQGIIGTSKKSKKTK